MTDRELINALIAQRRKAGLTQTAVAHRIGITPSAINLFENDTRRSPTMHTVLRYAKAIGATITIQENQ